MITITIYTVSTRERLERHVEANLDDAKDIAIGWLDSLGGLRGRSVALTTSRGASYRAVPRTRNNGPGRYVWERA